MWNKTCFKLWSPNHHYYTTISWTGYWKSKIIGNLSCSIFIAPSHFFPTRVKFRQAVGNRSQTQCAFHSETWTELSGTNNSCMQLEWVEEITVLYSTVRTKSSDAQNAKPISSTLPLTTNRCLYAEKSCAMKKPTTRTQQISSRKRSEIESIQRKSHLIPCALERYDSRVSRLWLEKHGEGWNWSPEQSNNHTTTQEVIGGPWSKDPISALRTD